MIKLVLASALIAVVSAQVLPLGALRQYSARPQVVPTYNPVPSPLPTYNPVPSPVYNQVASGPVIPIVRLDSDAAPDGSSYQYAYETANGIAAQEAGELAAPSPDAPLRVRGSYSYTSPEGLPVQISYIADENGFQPSGDVLPTPPPIPQAILRSIEFNLANPEPEQRIAPNLRNFK